MKSEAGIDELVPSSELCTAAGIKGTKTLTRWHQRRLIPKPTIGTHPNGRGKIAYWPRWVLDRCKKIRHLVDAGKTLKEIACILGNDWPAEKKKSRKRYRLSEVSPRMDLCQAESIFIELVTGNFFEFLPTMRQDIRPLSRRLDDFLVRDEIRDTVIASIDRGCNLILLWDGDEFQIAADFVAGQILADTSETGKSFVMVPLYRHAITAYEKVRPSAGPKPTLRPRLQVTETKGRTSVELELHRVGEAGYELVEQGARKTKRPARRKK